MLKDSGWRVTEIKCNHWSINILPQLHIVIEKHNTSIKFINLVAVTLTIWQNYVVSSNMMCYNMTEYFVAENSG